MRPILFSVIVMLSFLARAPHLAQANFLGSCTHAEGSQLYRPDGVVIRYEYRNARLVLVSMHTGDIVQTLDTSFITSDLANLDWSPDCHYLFGSANGDSIVWDAVNGGRAATFAGTLPKHAPYWNPTRDRLILEAYGGSYLWNFRQSDPILLDYSGAVCQAGYRYFNWEVVWDNPRGQVLVAPNYAGGGIVIAYDQTTAQQIASFDNGCYSDPVKFAVTPDDQHLIVFTSEAEAYARYYKTITVWDRDTMAHVSVDAHNQSAVLPTQVALSPDGRYLVLARIGTLRVWDLTALPDDLRQRDPIHRYAIEASTRSVRFVSDTTIETTDLQGNAHHWDVVTGEPDSRPPQS